MKKAITLILAFVLVLSLSATAFASAPKEDIPTKPGLDATKPQSFEFNKIYVDANGTQITEGKQPVEQLKFTVTPEKTYANAPQLSIADITTDANPHTVVISVAPNPNGATLGKYNYTIKETKGVTAGVHYDKNEIKVQVMVYKEGDAMKETITFTGEKGNKVTEIKNTYITNDDPNYGPITVDKVVTGNMGDVTAEFDIDVVLTSAEKVLAPITVNGNTVAATEWVKEKGVWTYTATLTLTDTTPVKSITGVPEGVTYVVTEQLKHTIIEPNVDYSNKPAEGYTATYEKATGEVKLNAENKAVVTNNKGAEVDTGISLDVLPYVIILGIAALSIVLFAVKRRVQE